jgi:hypothetical protein
MTQRLYFNRGHVKYFLSTISVPSSEPSEPRISVTSNNLYVLKKRKV